MNSSIQCLSNTYELTKFFLDRKYKSLIEKEIKIEVVKEIIGETKIYEATLIEREKIRQELKEHYRARLTDLEANILAYQDLLYTKEEELRHYAV